MSYLKMFEEIEQAALAAGWSRRVTKESARYGRSIYLTSPDGTQVVELDHGAEKATTYPESARVGDGLTREITSWEEVSHVAA